MPASTTPASRNLHKNANGQHDKSTNTQYFLALQYLVHHQLFVKVVGGYAKSHFDFSFSNMAPTTTTCSASASA